MTPGLWSASFSVDRAPHAQASAISKQNEFIPGCATDMWPFLLMKLDDILWYTIEDDKLKVRGYRGPWSTRMIIKDWERKMLWLTWDPAAVVTIMRMCETGLLEKPHRSYWYSLVTFPSVGCWNGPVSRIPGRTPIIKIVRNFCSREFMIKKNNASLQESHGQVIWNRHQKIQIT